MQHFSALAALKKQADEPGIAGSAYDLSVTTNQVVADRIRGSLSRTAKKSGAFLKERIPQGPSAAQ